ncbi:MAG: hypothetical protein H0W64_09230 [Gammaproteobacteria bacterium]|nr:hypothetical protein [Gammaproteobacteria bacterium]
MHMKGCLDDNFLGEDGSSLILQGERKLFTPLYENLFLCYVLLDDSNRMETQLSK